MKTFKITETRPATAIWEYYIEAETEEEALSKVKNEEIDLLEVEFEHDIEINNNSESEWCVEEEDVIGDVE